MRDRFSRRGDPAQPVGVDRGVELPVRRAPLHFDERHGAAAPGEKATSEADADALLRAALASEKPSQAAGQVAKATGLDRKALYARALELRNA